MSLFVLLVSAMIADDDVKAFRIGRPISIVNESLNLNVTIQEKFLKRVEDVEYLNFDFYQSRGVYNLMTCRASTDIPRRSTVAILRQVCNELRDNRDEAFRKSLMCGSVQASKFDKHLPRNKRMRAAAFARNDSISFKLPAVGDDINEVTCTSLTQVTRTNGNNVLWACIDDFGAIDYISKVVAYRTQQTLNSIEGSIDTTDGDDLQQDDHNDDDLDRNQDAPAAPDTPEPTETNSQCDAPNAPKRRSTILDFFRR